MKRLLLMTLAVLLIIPAAGCDSDDLDVFKTMGTTGEDIPEYSIAEERANGADLLVSTGSAKAAIADYVHENMGKWGDSAVTIQTVSHQGAGSVTCRLNYVGSESAGTLRTDLEPSDSYPALYLSNCG